VLVRTLEHLNETTFAWRSSSPPTSSRTSRTLSRSPKLAFERRRVTPGGFLTRKYGAASVSSGDLRDRLGATSG